MEKTSKTLISSQEDSPAKTSQSQDKEQDLKKERDPVFGLKCTGSLGRYDPDSHSLKMSQCSLFGEEQELLQILPKSAMMHRGQLSGLTMWERGTEGNGSGLWPTPQAMDARQDIRMRSELSEKAKKGGCSNLREEVHRRTFPTPDTQNHRDGTKLRKDNNLKEGGMHGVSLHHYITMFPTPTSRDWKDTGENVNWEKVAKKSRLAGAVMFPTPRANLLPGLITKTSATRNKGNLEEVVAEKENLTSGQLNPTWVEWLMGYPLGWTDLKDSETP